MNKIIFLIFFVSFEVALGNNFEVENAKVALNGIQKCITKTETLYSCTSLYLETGISKIKRRRYIEFFKRFKNIKVQDSCPIANALCIEIEKGNFLKKGYIQFSNHYKITAIITK